MLKELPGTKKIIMEGDTPAIFTRWSRLKLDDKGEKAIKDRVKAYIDKWEKNTVDLRETKIPKWDNMYDLIKKTKSFPWTDAANSAVPLTPTMVEQVQVKITSPFTHNVTKPIMVKGVEVNDVAGAEKLEQYINVLFVNEMEGGPTVIDLVGLAARHGTAAVDISWAKETKTLRNIEEVEVMTQQAAPIDGFNQPAMEDVPLKKYRVVETTYQTKNCPDWEIVELKDLVFPPDAETSDPDKFVFIGRQFWLTDEGIRTLHNEIELDHLPEIFKTQPEDKAMNSTVHAIDNPSQGTTRDDDTPEHRRFIKIFFSAEINGSDQECMFIYHPASGQLVYSGLLPHYGGKRPINLFRILRRPNRPLGIGIPESIETMAEEIDTIHNLRLDNGAIATAKFFTYIEGSGFDPNKHTIYPGAMIPVSSHDDFQAVKVGDVSWSGFQEETLTQKYAELRAGVGSYQGGKEAPGDAKAPMGKTLALIGQSDQKMSFLEFCFNLDFSRAMKITLALCYQNGDEETEYAIMGKAANANERITGKISRQQMTIGTDYFLAGPTSQDNAETERSFALQRYDLLMQNPIIQANPISMIEVTRSMLTAMGEKNVDKLAPMPAPVVGPAGNTIDPREVQGDAQMLQTLKSGMGEGAPPAGGA